jgi:multiple antibiotic resistance protein
MQDFLDIRFLGSVIVTLFVIMDPPAAVPAFLSLAGGKEPKVRARLARQATLTSMGVIVLFAVLGEQVLNYLKISLPALQGAGGLLLLLVSLNLLVGQEEEASKVKDVNIALVPLGTPLLAGPGAIVATILFARRAEGPSQWLALAVAVAVVHGLIWAALRFSGGIAKLLGTSGITVVSRIAGLLLAAIGVQLIADAVYGFIAAG